MKKLLLLIFLFVGASVPSSLFAQSAQTKKEKEVVEEAASIQANVVNNILQIKNAPIGSRVEIISVVGNKVKDFEMKYNSASFDLSFLPKGIYIFKIEGIVRKFIIK